MPEKLTFIYRDIPALLNAEIVKFEKQANECVIGDVITYFLGVLKSYPTYELYQNGISHFISDKDSDFLQEKINEVLDANSFTEYDESGPYKVFKKEFLKLWYYLAGYLQDSIAGYVQDTHKYFYNIQKQEDSTSCYGPVGETTQYSTIELTKRLESLEKTMKTLIPIVKNSEMLKVLKQDSKKQFERILKKVKQDRLKASQEGYGKK